MVINLLPSSGLICIRMVVFQWPGKKLVQLLSTTIDFRMGLPNLRIESFNSVLEDSFQKKKENNNSHVLLLGVRVEKESKISRANNWTEQ